MAESVVVVESALNEDGAVLFVRSLGRVPMHASVHDGVFTVDQQSFDGGIEVAMKAVGTGSILLVEYDHGGVSRETLIPCRRALTP